MRSNLKVLVAKKAQREQRRLTLRTVAEELNLSRFTVYAIANDTIKDYPKETIAALCEYFDCEISDLLLLVDVPVEGSAANR